MYKCRSLPACAFGFRTVIYSATTLSSELVTKLAPSPYYQYINMTVSSSLTIYRPGPSNALSTRSFSSSLISSHLFTQQTGTAILTELAYRILIDIINRFLHSFQRLASHGLDSASSWMERKLQERRDRLDTSGTRGENLKIVEEVGKLVEERGFVTCPMTGREMSREEGMKGPPKWVRGVLDGIDEGRMRERDFWIHTHGD
ncbi:hypothetical protein BKA58DRAFT_93285 [Alternaria rosae]|uniref:uncharacterized protein n=1 Tax=Alternaria rosae TaxID=1187941 RepID=UPI001E8D7193|nr:uncharacterized protein BKA58DRAFT_93285 [Alternaria rosae]KAH6878333.1 hypothetical protein BKA58DRAFT_93285 [Alternaria rosae]